jgi:hypothetical protein
MLPGTTHFDGFSEVLRFRGMMLPTTEHSPLGNEESSATETVAELSIAPPGLDPTAAAD